MSVCATGSIFYFNSFIDVNKNAFMMYGDRRRLIVKRFDGEIVTTIDLPLESNWTNRWGVRNSRGQIAVIMRVRDQSGIVVLTPP